MSEWKYHTPERDGHAPDDWVEGMETEFQSETPGVWNIARVPTWSSCFQYRYRPLQDATVEPSFDTLKDQCLRLPQVQREALIEAMQADEIDWTNDVWLLANAAWEEGPTAAEGLKKVKQVIRSMCRPKEVRVPEQILQKYARKWDTHAPDLCEFLNEALS